MTGIEVIEALRAKFGASGEKELADILGVPVSTVKSWQRRKNVTAAQFAILLHSTSRKGSFALQRHLIRPLVEFFPIEKSESKSGATFRMFDAQDNHSGENLYRIGLRQELDGKYGVYLFFDSRGQAIYVGKARKQTLWKEMNLAFNRERGEVQMIKRVNHPEWKQDYKTSDEKARHIAEYRVPLCEIASYFSAYEVEDPLTDDVEALLVRSFANNLLNKRMERFASLRDISKRRAKRL